MKILTLFAVLAVVAFIGLLVSACFRAWQNLRGHRSFSNFNAGEHKNAVTRSADAVLAFSDANEGAAGYLLKEGATPGSTVAIIAAVTDKPAFIALDGADAIGDPVTCGLLNATNVTRKMIAAGAIAAGSAVFSNGDGTVTGVPVAAGEYWEVGQARSSATGAGDILEVEPCVPCRVQVIAVSTATTVANLVTAFGNVSGPSKILCI